MTHKELTAQQEAYRVRLNELLDVAKSKFYLSMPTVAEAVGLSKNSIAPWRYGRNPTPYGSLVKIEKLVKWLEVNVGDKGVYYAGNSAEAIANRVRIVAKFKSETALSN